MTRVTSLSHVAALIEVVRRSNHGYRVAVYEFDDSRRPLLILRMREQVSTEDIAMLQADLDAVVDRVEPFAIVFDIADVQIPPRAQIMDILSWNRTMRARYIELYDHAVPRVPSFAAYHMPSMLGNLLRFFQQMLPSTRGQQVVCKTFEEAVAACEGAIERMERARPRARAAG